MNSLNIRRNAMSLCIALFGWNIKCLSMSFMNVRIRPTGFPALPTQTSSKIEGMKTEEVWWELKLNNFLLNCIKIKWIIFRCLQEKMHLGSVKVLSKCPLMDIYWKALNLSYRAWYMSPHLSHQEASSHPANPSELAQVAHYPTVRFRGDNSVALPPSGRTWETIFSSDLEAHHMAFPGKVLLVTERT